MSCIFKEDMEDSMLASGSDEFVPFFLRTVLSEIQQCQVGFIGFD